MATKLVRMLTYLDDLLPIKSHDPLIMWSCKIPWQTKIILSSLSYCLWPPNVTSHKLTWSFDYVVLWDRVTTENCYIFTTTAPMTTKLGKLVTFYEGILSTMLLHPLVTWSYKITWEAKTIISPLPRYLWPQNRDLPWLPFAHKFKWPYHLVLWDHVANWRHLHYHNAYGRKTWQDEDLPSWVNSTH